MADPHHPEVAPAIFEEAHDSQGQIRAQDEAAERALVLGPGLAEHGFADRPALGDADGARALIEEVIEEASGEMKSKAQRALSNL